MHSTDDTESFIETPPHADALIESLRNFGYSLEAAISDLIDNSITAGARNIWIEARWNSQNSALIIRDDGRGMNEETLQEAMRPGTLGPQEERQKHDLGRYGLGLKTASFSQCRRVSVITRPESERMSTRVWDLDYVVSHRSWRLLTQLRTSTQKIFESLNPLESGTIVIWENLDRLISRLEISVSAKKAEDRFLKLIEKVEAHIAMVFHRFMEGRGKIAFFINGRLIEPWDPFLLDENATQFLPDETTFFHNAVIKIQPYVLPHHSRLSPDKHRQAAGIKGWNAHQGFYVYRNQRLLLAGDWLGLPFKKEEHYKLVRIQVDIPNTVDDEWQINVTKARARLPNELQDQFHRIARAARERAVEVYRHRGRVIARSATGTFNFGWKRVHLNGRVSYQINEEHPIIADVLQRAGDLRPALLHAFKVIEETIPIQSVTIDAAENEQQHQTPFSSLSPQEIRSLLNQTIDFFRAQGLSPGEIRGHLLGLEGFSRFRNNIDQLLLELEG